MQPIARLPNRPAAAAPCRAMPAAAQLQQKSHSQVRPPLPPPPPAPASCPPWCHRCPRLHAHRACGGVRVRVQRAGGRSAARMVWPRTCLQRPALHWLPEHGAACHAAALRHDPLAGEAAAAERCEGGRLRHGCWSVRRTPAQASSSPPSHNALGLAPVLWRGRRHPHAAWIMALAAASPDAWTYYRSSITEALQTHWHAQGAAMAPPP